MNRFALIALLFVSLACVAQEAGTVEKISPQDAAAQVSTGKAVLVDVRERSELDAGMAQGARWYPTSSIKSDPDGFHRFIASLPADQTIVLYCASGGRSGKAAEIATQQGRKAANAGGFKDWKGAGLPTEAPAKTLEPG